MRMQLHADTTEFIRMHASMLAAVYTPYGACMHACMHDTVKQKPQLSELSLQLVSSHILFISCAASAAP